MKKAICVLLLALGGAIALLPFVLFLILYEVGDELLLTSVSPGGTYTVEVHRINPGAWDPFSIQCFRIDGSRKERIYTCRGEEDAELTWLTEDTVRINTVALNLAEGETYFGDLGKPESFTFDIRIRAEDVSGIRLEYLLGEEPIGGQSVSGCPRGDEAVPLRGAVTFSFKHRQDIPLLEQLEQEAFGIIPTVDAQGTCILLPFLFQWQADWGGAYRFILSGNAEDGFSFAPDFDGCSVLSP